MKSGKCVSAVKKNKQTKKNYEIAENRHTTQIESGNKCIHFESNTLIMHCDS